MTASKIVAAAASSIGGEGLDVDEVFSTYLYDGNGGTKVIENGIALGNSNDGGSVNFNGVAGATGDWVVMPSSADFGYGTGDFTIEFFVYFKAIGIVYTIWDQRTSSQDYTTASILIFVETDGTIRFDTLSSAGTSSGRIEGSVSAGQWYHMALCRSGTSTKMFLNGTQTGSTFSDSTNYVTPASNWSIGGSAEQNSYSSNAYISNVRVVKGTALYTSNFTAPTSELTAVTNTKLLTLQGDTPFVDNSSSSHSITTNGSPTASEFGPFTGSDGEGGLVWLKRRTGTPDHAWYDTERGANSLGLASNTTSAAVTVSGKDFSSFNSNGFTVKNDALYNYTNDSGPYASWTFRKAPKFFDVVTYTGTQDGDKTISHSLNTTVGMAIIKRYDSAGYDWHVYHRSRGTSKYLLLNSTNAEASGSIVTATSNTSITLSQSNGFNTSGATYVAYLFAHNNGDGEFGPDGDQDVIKCGSYTGNGSASGPTVNLGFEPQWIMIKDTTSANYWMMFDNMRGLPAAVANSAATLKPNGTDAEFNAFGIDLSASGFQITDSNGIINNSGNTYIYMAIRRGPLAEPESATDVFSIDTLGSSAPYFDSNHIVDMALVKSAGASSSWFAYSRLAGEKALEANTTAAEFNASEAGFDFMDGHIDANWGGTDTHSWMWKRAPSYFDVVAYSGTGSTTTINHNLGVVPEMIWIKKRSGSNNWKTFHSSLGATKSMELNTTVAAEDNGSALWNSTSPTASVFTVGSAGDVNSSSHTYIAYLFATLAGVSKVGSYTGNGSTQTIDCGFSSGARFVLIKITSDTGDWRLYDTVRGIVAGDDPQLVLNNNSAELSSGYDLIDPHSSGFALPASPYTNDSGETYIFYAIA